MRAIENIIQFIEIISDRSSVLDTRKKDTYHLIKLTEIIKEFIWMTEMSSKDDASEKYTTEEIDRFIDLNYEYLYSYIYSKNHESPHEPYYFYRGVSNNQYPIVSGIYRENEKHSENYYFNEINARCPDAFRTLDNLGRLAYMQHYGCPTRLLDITTNPLVALYFACAGNDEKNGSVYIFAIDSNDVLYANSDRIHMLSKLAEFKKKDQDILRHYAYRYIRQDKFPQNSNKKYVLKQLEQFYHAIVRIHSGFEREIIPFDLLKPQFVLPNKENLRILKQDGAFIISALDSNAYESDMKIRKALIEEITIDVKAKKRILNELGRVGINQASLFPEVEKVADYLRKNN